MTEVADDYNAGFQTALAGLNTFFKQILVNELCNNVKIKLQ